MLYCKKCKTLFDTEHSSCPGCGEKKDFKQPDTKDYIYLHRADAETAQALTEAFEKLEIRYQVEPFAQSQVSCLYSAESSPSDKAIYVLYADLEKAKACAGTMKRQMEAAAEIFTDMPPAKRKIVKIISAVLFFALVAVTVFFADYVADAVKNFITALFK